MAKILIALALLIAVATANLSICRPQTCANRGAVCDSIILANVSATATERYCKADDYCKTNAVGDLTGVCTVRSAVGQACTDNGNECEHGLSCVSKFCNRGFYPGAKCKVANDCLYFAENGDATAACNAGRCGGVALGGKCRGTTQSCLPPNTCGPDNVCIAALGTGSKCDSNSDCQFNLYCNDSTTTCIARAAIGQACIYGEGDDQCVWDAQCVPTAQSGAGAATATCRAVFSGAAGAVCGDSQDCAEGLACLSPVAPNVYGACGPVVASSRKACNATRGADTTQVCSANENCQCNNNNGNGVCFANANVVVKKGAKGKFNSYGSCVAKCARTDWNCIEKCEGKICSFLRNRLDEKDDTDYLELDCSESDAKAQILPGYVECSSASFVSFSLIGMVAVVAAMLL